MRRILAIVVATVLVFVNGPGQVLAYSDTQQHWAQKDINRLSSQKIVDGIQGKYLPNQPVTRAQFAKMIVSALDLGEEALLLKGMNGGYTDVPNYHWAAGYITVAREKGIVTGFADGRFQPDALIKRSEIAVMLLRALKPLGDELYQGPLGFADQSGIPAWAQKEVSQAVQLELIRGYEDNTFRPQRPTTRAEATSLLTRYLQILGRAYDFLGEVQKIDTKLKTVNLRVDGQESIFLYSDQTIFYNGDKIGTQEIITSGQSAYFNLDKNGYITYLEITSDKKPSTLQYMGGLDVYKPDAKPATKLTLAKQKLMLAESDSLPKNLQSPEKSLQVTKQAMSVKEFAEENQVAGSGQTIAIIDTGVDVGHPDLLVNPSGQKKVVDWVDYTDEGKVVTGHRGTANNGYLILDEVYNLGSIKSISGAFKLGFFKEQSIRTESGQGLDVNQNGVVDDEFTVLLVDSNKSGQYDTLYMDTNSDRNFADENPLLVYRVGKQFTQISGADGSRFDLVVAEIDPAGEYVKLGFDGNGHGTHVAGIAAANGQLQGVAPAASLMVIKVIDSEGAADWNNILKAVEYAAKNGAKVINLSLGYRSSDPQGNSWENTVLAKIVDRYKVTIVVAAGNSGPGLETMAIPANSSSVISVGAYISPEMWANEFDYKVEKDSLWYWSSMGPRGDGAFMPSVVAPGSAVSTVNFRKYDLMEGTSMAAPHVAGAVALLREAAAKKNVSVTPEAMQRAISLGAKRLPGFNEVEQGHGLVNLPETWQILSENKKVLDFDSQVFNQQLGTGVGLYTRGLEPGQLTYKVANPNQQGEKLKLSTTAEWLKLDRQELSVAKSSSRNFNVEFNVPQEPGLYTAIIYGDVESTVGADMEILNTLIKPYNVVATNNELNLSGNLPPAQFKRYFIQVEPGTKDLNLALSIRSDGNNGFNGRARLHLFGPDGVEYKANAYEFAGMNPYGNKPTVTKQVPNPKAGVWEIIVYSSAMLLEYNLNQSEYDLQVAVQPGEGEQETGSGPSLIMSVLPGQSSVGKTKFVTLQVRYRLDKRPYRGVLEIDGKLYSVNNGKVIFATKSEKTLPEIKVKTIR